MIFYNNIKKDMILYHSCKLKYYANYQKIILIVNNALSFLHNFIDVAII